MYVPPTLIIVTVGPLFSHWCDTKRWLRLLKLDHLPHESLVYPPNMYFPTLMIVTVGPLLSHPLWKVLADQPSTDAHQQRFHREDSLWATGLSHVLNLGKWCTLSPKITESASPFGRTGIREEKKKSDSGSIFFRWYRIWRMEQYAIKSIVYCWHLLNMVSINFVSGHRWLADYSPANSGK